MELSLKKMGALMANISKFVNQIPIERMLTVNSKYYSTPRANLWENLTPSPMAHRMSSPMGTPKSKFIKMIVGH